MTNIKKRVYEDGVKFTCQSSGNCCKLIDGWVELNDAELSRAADFLNMGKNQFIFKYVARSSDEKHFLKTRKDKACIFLSKNNLCQIYEARPGHCRYFPFRPENMKSKSRWDQTREFCQGIGNGKFFSKDDIKIILRKQRKK